MSAYHVKTTINGDPVEFVCEAEEALLDVLRDRLGLTGAKEGCGTGDCGACSIMSKRGVLLRKAAKPILRERRFPTQGGVGVK